MDTAKEIRKGEALDWQKLEDYLRAVLDGIDGEMSVAQFHGGHANLTYLITFGSRAFVVRRPPFGKIAPGAHDMKREYKVLSKLFEHYPRAPRAFHLCEDETVIGARFVVLEKRSGVVVRTKVIPEFQSFEKVEERLVTAMMKAMAELHLVDHEAADLANLGRPEGFVERQLKGWAQRWELSKSADNVHMDAVLQLLQSTIPKEQRVSIIHNDIKLDNCQFQPDNPDEVTSIFDWDMCTLGDPLIDLGTTLSYYPDHTKKKLKNLPVQLHGNFPPKEFLIEQYRVHSGLSMENMAWYEAFAYWKGAIVAQQLFRRYLNGATKDKRMAGFETAMQEMAKLAHQILEH
ncbi:MAG: phosphotransferase family protein [Saprospiraceae bacterium]|nr:phosphotransferase family protein [Saprospiraceae bacterium]